MKLSALCLASFLLPTTAFAITAQDKVDIAERLTKAYPAITVTVESNPVISPDKDPVVFRITPSGKRHFGKLFLKGRYDIIHTPSDNHALGTYLCDIADDFIKERREEQVDFLPEFTITIGPEVRSIRFEIQTDQDTLHAMFYAIVTLWDFLKDDYGKFNLLTRGYADQGASFSGRILEEYPFHYLALFPATNSTMLIYLRELATRTIGDTFTNADLPNLRGTFFKRVIDDFLNVCRLSQKIDTKAFVLDGAVIDENAPDYRTIDLYFYAYR